MINLIGSKGKTGGIELEGPFYANDGKTFNKKLLDVGTIQTIELGVYSSQMFDGWKPKRVDIYDIYRQHIYVFEHDESEVDNKLITLQRTACITVERGYLDGKREPKYKLIDTIFGCMMFCLENNCVQAEYRTTGICQIVARGTKVVKWADDRYRVLTPQCVNT
ncbi:uncharacterized protein LOC127839865 [Dreissena polymorpha]|uniref:Uncharacterized protein n=1 Tax=Dreissena polymorpha TaxID=45954 RepID=A0A9D4FJS1_DREPO|nr:uncharacterized protein LOC127839865 [Dreissena polymorpha]KAH3800050.1 hypothetical protein DPMN_153675 [Dreissena polymorpha]